MFQALFKGERWELNPRVEEPQTSALTTWLRSPFIGYICYYKIMFLGKYFFEITQNHHGESRRFYKVAVNSSTLL
jgi:hypothetical protein